MNQSSENHTRWLPIYHFVASPIAGLYLIYTVVQVWREPSAANAIASLFAVGVACGILAARVMALTVQNRVIRLEMRLRLKELLPSPLLARVGELTTRHFVALRFAGDAEMPALVERVLKGEFARTRDIKRAIRDWQGDYLRA